MIKTTFRKYGDTFTLYARGMAYLIYERKNRAGQTIAYELHVLKWRPSRVVNQTVLLPTNRLPHEEDFGRCAWSFLLREKAIQRFHEMEKKNLFRMIE